MTKKDNQTTTTAATENNEERKNVLEEGEIMRLSIRRLNDETFDMNFISDGPAMPMVQALTQIMNQEFDMICLPKKQFGGIIEIGFGTMADVEDEGNGEGKDTDAKGEDE